MDFQTATNQTVATRTRGRSKNWNRSTDFWNFAAHSGHANHSTHLIRPVIASRDVAETIYGV